MLPYSLVASFLESGTLVEPLPGLEMPYPNLYALYPEAGRQPSSLKAFVSWLIEQGEDFSTRLERVRPIPASQQSVSPLVL